PSPGGEEIQQEHLPPKPRRVVWFAVDGGERQLRQRPIDQALERRCLSLVAAARKLSLEPRVKLRRHGSGSLEVGQRLRRPLPQRRRTTRERERVHVIVACGPPLHARELAQMKLIREIQALQEPLGFFELRRGGGVVLLEEQRP